MPYKDAVKQRKWAAESAKRSYDAAMAEVRDIGKVPDCANPRRRGACRRNLRLYLETYLSQVFYLPWSTNQKELIAEIQHLVLHGGLKSVAMPRGEGKTSICLGAINWAISYGHRRYIYFIRASQEDSEVSLRSIKVDWENNDLLYEDFPEIAHAIRHLGGSWQRAKMQAFNSKRTFAYWGADEVHFPCLHGYKYHKDDNQAGIVIRTAGIGSSIRGAQHKHPLTGETIRPDFVFLDDVQTDKVAASPAGIDKMIDVIDGAIKGLSPPGELISAIMPCTVIQERDVADTYLDKAQKPEWRGMRCRMVQTWPPGITDDEISDDTPEGKHWLEYQRLRVESLMDKGDISEATKYYRKHRKAMNNGFQTSWKSRYNGNKRYLGNKELSSQQHAMNLRLENMFTFSAEYQNEPKKAILGQSPVPAPETIMERTVDYEPCILPTYVRTLVGMIDVQDEAMFYVMMGLGIDYTGIITMYGTWPQYQYRYITKAQMAKWKRLSWSFYKAHPDFPRDFTLSRTKMKQAPFEAKIRFGLEQTCNHLLLQTEYKLENGEVIQPDLLAIDCKWGQAAEVVKRFAREYGDSRIVPYEGTYVGAASKQLSEYNRKDGSIFEDQFHRGLQVCRWVGKPDRGVRKIISDVNRWKTFLINRLAAPMGAPGAIVLHNAHPAEHEMIAQHLSRSEFPEPVTARGRTLMEWKVSKTGVDNDFLDCAAGCMCMASMKGCRISEEFMEHRDPNDTMTTPERPVQSVKTKKEKLKVSEIMAARREARQKSSTR